MRSAPCPACGSRRRYTERATFVRNPKKSFVVEVCKSCGYVANPGNFNDYKSYDSVERFPVSARVGTDARPGREFFMASMGCEILNRSGIRVLVVGPGASLDFRRITALPGVSAVAIGDIVRLREDIDYIDLTQDSQRRFDLVLASEVIEHFVEPATEFARLFRSLKSDGLLMCSTNVYDGGNLSHHKYLFIKGHTSYYSPQALRSLAQRNNVLVDFRLPAVSARLGPRKRYVLFSSSAARMQDVAEYFGRHPYAPSEE